MVANMITTMRNITMFTVVNSSSTTMVTATAAAAITSAATTNDTTADDDYNGDGELFTHSVSFKLLVFLDNRLPLAPLVSIVINL